jgi:hypothetical protein
MDNIPAPLLVRIMERGLTENYRNDLLKRLATEMDRVLEEDCGEDGYYFRDEAQTAKQHLRKLGEFFEVDLFEDEDEEEG